RGVPMRRLPLPAPLKGVGRAGGSTAGRSQRGQAQARRRLMGRREHPRRGLRAKDWRTAQADRRQPRKLDRNQIIRRMTMTEIKLRSDMGVELIDHMGSDRMVAEAARVSTLGLDNDRAKYVGLVRALMRDQHWSPFMHPQMTIAFEVPLFVRSQLVTHYSLARSEFSMRYSEAKPQFWVPADERPLVQVGKALDYQREMGTVEQALAARMRTTGVAQEAWDSYLDMIEAGVTAEVARTVLPQSTYTTLWLTGNLRSWLSFIGNRMDKHAQWETQEVGTKVAEIFAERFPVTFEAWSQLHLGGGAQIVPLQEVSQ